MKSPVKMNYRQHFPILEQSLNGCPLVYFDNAATTHKPQHMIEAYQLYHETTNANVHRASHTLSAKATREFESARITVQNFIGAESSQEVIWTQGATHSINIVAQAWGFNHLKPNDEIIVSQAEHHANIVPWQMICEVTGAVLKVLNLTDDGTLCLEHLVELLNDKTKMVAVGHVSNVVGKYNPVKALVRLTNEYAPQSLTLIDGSQAVAHTLIDVQALACDFYVFSAHKMFGPTGVGVLYGRKSVLENIPPYQGGGEMIKQVSFNHTTYNELPFKFEAGTPNIAGVIAFASSIHFMNDYDEYTQETENTLTEYLYQQLCLIDEVEFLFNNKPDIPLFSFNLKKQHNFDVAASLNSVGIAVRTGHHCAMPLMEYLNVTGCIRFSLAAYNTKAEIDYVIAKLKGLLSEDEDTNIVDNHGCSEYLLSTVDWSERYNQILHDFNDVKSWDARHRLIMLLGKSHERLDAAYRIDANEITGCESNAWLIWHQDNKGLLHFYGDSDAKVVRGLMQIILAKVNQKTAEEIVHMNFDDYFNMLGILMHLSPSRGNGLLAITNKIKTIAQNVR